MLSCTRGDMNQITLLLMKSKTRDKKFLYYSYIANIVVVSVFLMIATGLKNLTNDTLSSSDTDQMLGILASVISVSILTIIFFQWIISMQFRALFDSRKQFNNNMRLMGIKNSSLMKIYITELFRMQIVAVPIGIVIAQIMYWIIAGIIKNEVVMIGTTQIVFAILIHIAVILFSVFLTFKGLMKKSVIEEIRSKDDRNSVPEFTPKMKQRSLTGIIIGVGTLLAPYYTQDEQMLAMVKIGYSITFTLVLDLILVICHKLLSAFAKRNVKYRLLFSDFISFGYYKKVKNVCFMIVFSGTIFLGLQMLYRSIRLCGADNVESNIHYKYELFYDEMQETQAVGHSLWGLRYKTKTESGSNVFISGICSKYLNEYENICINETIGNKFDLEQAFDREDWDGIILPDYFMSSSDIGKKMKVDIDGKSVTFTIKGGYLNNNFGKTLCLVSQTYLAKQMGIQQKYNMLYLKDEKDLERAEAIGHFTSQSFDEIRQESYDKAVGGTVLVEIVSIVIIMCAMFSLMNFFVLTSKSKNVDIAKLRGAGVSKHNIMVIYLYEAIFPVMISFICTIPLAISFADVGCKMVLNPAYYKQGLVYTPVQAVVLFLMFGVVSVATQVFSIRKVTCSSYYLKILRDSSL